jgi:hypothetical protein
MFATHGQDGDTLLYRNIVVYAESCGQKTCVSIIDERSTTTVVVRREID